MKNIFYNIAIFGIYAVIVLIIVLMLMYGVDALVFINENILFTE